MDRHIRLLDILSTLWGALATLVGVSMLLLMAGAIAILWAPEGESVALPAGVTAAVFASIGIFSLLFGVAHVWAAMLIRRRASRGRLLMLALAVVNLLIFPFGTGLGAYALWILLNNEGRRLFE